MAFGMLHGELKQLDFGPELLQLPILALESVLHAQNDSLACPLQVPLPLHELIVLLQAVL